MQNFDLGALDAWKQVDGGELLAFDLPTVGYRKVDFDVLADGPVRVVAFGPNDKTWLVGYGQGLLSVRFTATDDVCVAVFGADDVVIHIRTKCATLALAEFPEETFTTIEPRAGHTDEFRRLTHLMRINQEQREAQLRGEILALRNEVIAGRSETVLSEPDVNLIDEGDGGGDASA